MLYYIKMTKLVDTKFVYLDVETTGLSPANGDRIVEFGLVECKGIHETSRLNQMINPGRPISRDAQLVNGISDHDVQDCPPFGQFAEEIALLLAESWIVGHNVQFDIGFLAMELRSAGHLVIPFGCIDTCQLSSSLWRFPNNQLETVVRALNISTERSHRALDDTLATREVFHHVVAKVGGWDNIYLSDILKYQDRKVTWPGDASIALPKILQDAIKEGRSIAIRYTKENGQSSIRTIRPESSFVSGRHTYIRAYCESRKDTRTFRLDRIDVVV